MLLAPQALLAQMVLTELLQQLPLERLRQVQLDRTQLSQTVAAAPLQPCISASLEELQAQLAPQAQQALRVQLELMELMELMVQQRQFLLERSLQVPLDQAQLLRTAVVALQQHLTSASLVGLLERLVQRVPLARQAPLVQMEATGLRQLFLLAL